MTQTNLLNDKTILVTGGTGSFGHQFIKYVLSHYSPKKIIVYSRDEYKQFVMSNEEPYKSNSRIMRFFIGDVRDKERLERAMEGVDYVVHAAALKQVPACEYNPAEAIRTNVHGAMNVIDAALDRGVKKVVALSTDKAVNPVNLYGGTKLVSDKLFIAANAYAGNKDTSFSIVRHAVTISARRLDWKKFIISSKKASDAFAIVSASSTESAKSATPRASACCAHSTSTTSPTSSGSL